MFSHFFGIWWTKADFCLIQQASRPLTLLITSAKEANFLAVKRGARKKKAAAAASGGIKLSASGLTPSVAMWKWDNGEEEERAGASWCRWGRGGRGEWGGNGGRTVLHPSITLPAGFLFLSSPFACFLSPPLSPPRTPGAFLTSSHSPSALYLPRLPTHPPFRPAPLHQPPQDFMIPLNDRWDALDSTFSPLGVPPPVPPVPELCAGQRLEGGEVAPPSPILSWNVCVAGNRRDVTRWRTGSALVGWSRPLGDPTCLHSSVLTEWWTVRSVWNTQQWAALITFHYFYFPINNNIIIML